MLLLCANATSYLPILRAVKNRLAHLAEIGIFEMQSGGLLRCSTESSFPEERLDGATEVRQSVIHGRDLSILAEVQALVIPTMLGNAGK